MADRKMTKEEMAAQMGISVADFDKRTQEAKERLARDRQPAVAAPAEERAAPQATTEKPSAMDRLKGTLRDGFNAVADAAGSVVQLGRDLGSALDRANTNDSEQNRRWQRQEQQAGIGGPPNPQR